MLFNSIEFLIFLPIVFVAFWLFPKKYKWTVLLIASYVFYMWWSWKLVFIILFTTVVSYVCGVLLYRYKDNIKTKRIILSSALGLCFGILLFFKYFAFLADVYSDIIKIFNGEGIHGYFDIVLPVGISFYTFQTASYVIDCYNGKITPEWHFGYYALFVTFFPQLVAGPIERPNDLLPQLHLTGSGQVSIKQIDYSGAFRIMLIGFFKKIAIADVLGIYVNKVYQDINGANGLMVLIATLLFAIQILCDFSGYSDIAVGCAKLFGVNLTENFNNPYISTSIKDFWTRWHISLSRWLRDYIYFPLGGSRVNRVRWIINVLIVFFVSGLWHGANYTFIVWGLLHGIFQIIGVLTQKPRNELWKKIKVDPEGKLVCILRILGTFILVDFCWIFFRANTISDAGTAIAKMFTDWQFNLNYFEQTFNMLDIQWWNALYITSAILSLVLINKLKTITSIPYKLYNVGTIRYSTYYYMIMSVIGTWIFLQAADVGSSFIYFQF